MQSSRSITSASTSASQASLGSSHVAQASPSPQNVLLDPQVFERPKRPLSAYNLFFKREREQMLQQGISLKKLGFKELARTISRRWKTIDPQDKKALETHAGTLRRRYFEEIQQWPVARTFTL